MTQANPYAQETLANLLQGKVIIVTGGNSGIGKSIVEEVARLGAKVVIDYRSHPEVTEAIEEEIGELGGSCIGVQADVGKLEDLQRLVQEAVGRYGRLDVMVNNAGIETRTSILDTTPEELARCVLRHPIRRKADDCPGQWRPHHQHLLRARGLAHAQ
jgi:glucose 1-dehydrogenase